MALVEFPRNPSPATMRWFGALLGLFFALVAGVVLWQVGPGWAFRALAALAVLLPLLYQGVPPLRRPMFLAWTGAAYPLGLAVSFALLAVVWYGVVTPIGLASRLAGRDPLGRRFEPGRSTYWVSRGGPHPPERYFRPW